MQHLRLVGVHDDGKHLLLSGTGGEMFRLPIDEALRVAASRTSVRAASGAGTVPITMSPRDIQARIRSGATAAEVAELSGIPLAKVQRYEGPVLAEREYVAHQARKVEVASPAPGHDAYRSVFGDNPASLEEMVEHRLAAYGVESSTVEWDSWRRPDGNWNVVARFQPMPGGPAGIGEEPPARWTFNPARKSLQNANRWAQLLSELEPLDGPLPARRLSAVSDRPFDFESDADAAARTAAAQHNAAQQLPVPQGKIPQEQDGDGLLDMLRSRRGQRLGTDEDADDALALLLTNGAPAAHPRPSEVEEEPKPDSADDRRVAPDAEQNAAPAADPVPGPDPDAGGRARDGRPSMQSRITLTRPKQDEDSALKLPEGVGTGTREITIAASQLRPIGQKPTSSPGLEELLGGGTPRRQQRDSPDGAPADREAEQPERQPARPKRSSVPSWDDIVFGTRGD
ncbi:MAG: hypothetical protein JWO49_950 [Arthrobacter sp.]|nr:hypothetical protein [Arthrobacter sp.]